MSGKIIFNENIRELFINPSKVHFETGRSQPLFEETKFSKKLLDDAPFIRLAAHFKTTILTTDNPLIQELGDLNIAEKYGFSVMTPSDFLI